MSSTWPTLCLETLGDLQCNTPYSKPLRQASHIFRRDLCIKDSMHFTFFFPEKR